jgi:chromosome segregation ATPase
MTSQASRRPKSTVSVQDAEVETLKNEIELLRFNQNALRQECEEWKRKHRDQKDEVFRLSGASSKHGRRIQDMEAKSSAFAIQLADKDKEVSRLRANLAQTQKRMRDAEARTKTLPRVSHSAPKEPKSSSCAAELEFTRSRLIQSQQEYANLKKVHTGIDCAESLRRSTQQVAEAKRLQQAAEAETKSLQYLGHVNELIKEQNSQTQTQLLEAIHESRINKAKVVELENEVKLYSAQSRDAENRVTELEAELLQTKSETPDTNSCTNLTKSPSFIDLGFSHITSLQTKPLAPLVTAASNELLANIIIHVDALDQKNWSLLKRIQSVMAKTSKLDIHGPQDLVSRLVAAMESAEADHIAQAAAAAHWKQIAEDLQGRPPCIVPGHRNVVDELEAKTLQLQLQATLVAQWQKKMDRVSSYIADSNVEMRERGMRGV